MSSTLSNQEELTCEECGRFGAIEVADRKLCPDCYQTCGACCAGSDDDEESC